MHIILSQDARSSLRLQCNTAGHASEVAISSYTMASDSTEVKMLTSGDNVPMRTESESEQVTFSRRHYSL